MGRGHVGRERHRLGESVGVRPLPRRTPRDSLRLPPTLAWWRARPEGAAWLDRLPQLVDRLASRWRLTIGEPYPSHVALVLRAERAGTPVVLKVGFVEPESEHEGDALSIWPDDASVRVLERDRNHGALLLERCVPGTTLWELPDDDALAIAARVLERLWSAGDPGAPFRRLAEEAPHWIEELASRPFEPALLEPALAALRELPSTQGPPVLCNEDFHGGNVLLSERGWLAIDPKPIVAEREFGVVSLVRDRRPIDAATVQRRLDVLGSELRLDRERMRRWSLAHALWWGHAEAARALMR